MNNKHTIFLIFCVIAILSGIQIPAESQPLTWKTITSQRAVLDMAYQSGHIWAVTSGGIFRYTIETNNFELFTNTEGLSSIPPSAIAFDENGKLWIGMNDGTLNVIKLDNLQFRHVTIDPEPLKINDIVYQKNSLYLALDFGISLFLIDKEEINSTFRALGDFSINTPVHKLFVHEDKLWAASEQGIASVELNSPNLQDPQFWRNYTVNNGLSSNTVTGFAVNNGMLYVSTENGIARLEGDRFSHDGLQNAEIRTIAEFNGSLYAAGIFAVYKRVGPGNWQIVQPELRDIIALVQDNEGWLWGGHMRNGLYLYDHAAPDWINVPPAGPGGNTFEEMITDSKNRLWAATGQSANNGIYMYDSGIWEHYTTADGLSSNNTTGIAEGPEGRIWVGTPGKGVIILDKRSGSLHVTKIDTAGGRLVGSDTPDFVVVPKIKRDNHGNMWILNKYAANGNALVVVTPEDVWHYFSVADGLASVVVTQIAIDEFNRVWTGTERSGVNMLDYGGTLGDKSDDIWQSYTTSDGLSSNIISGIAAEEDNGIWIATFDGINHIIDNFPIQVLRGALSNFITAFAVDPVHNKWFGTPNGVSVLQSDDFSWFYLTGENSKLVDNWIISIFFDDETGTAYIGTASGLSVVATPYKKPPLSASRISVYPNPFILDGSNTRLTIENLLLESTVKIFTITGRMVKELTLSNGGVFGTQAFWDGTDTNGRLVPSGIYLVAAGQDNKNTGTQKVAVIRK